MAIILILAIALFGVGALNDLSTGLMSFLGILILLALLFFAWPLVVIGLIIWGIYALFFRQPVSRQTSESRRVVDAEVEPDEPEEPAASVELPTETPVEPDPATTVPTRPMFVPDYQNTDLLDEMLTLLTALEFTDVRVNSDPVKPVFDLTAIYANRKYGFNIQPDDQLVMPETLTATATARAKQGLSFGVIVTNAELGPRTPTPTPDGPLQVWNRAYRDNLRQQLPGSEGTIQPLLNPTVENSQAPAFRFHGSQVVPLQLPAGYQQITYRFNEDLQIEVLDANGNKLPTPEGLLDGTNDWLSTSNHQTLFVSEVVNFPSARQVLLNIDTDGDWDFEVSPITRFSTDTEFKGYGWQLLPVSLPKGNYLVRLIAAATENSNTVALYTNVSGFAVSANTPVDTSHIFKLENDDPVFLQLRTDGAWELQLKALKLF